MGSDAMKVMNLNERAWKIADDLASRADELRLAVQTLPSGARVIDAGIEVHGGYGAGIGLAELCMGGLGHIRYAELEIGGCPNAGRGVTGEDGRITNLLDAELEPGWYQIVFDLASYYGSQQHFFSRVTLDVAIAETRHHHVPLLVSPFSCASYRGS